MGRLYIREYGNVASFPGGTAPVGQEPGLDQVIVFGAASTQSAPTDGHTRMVRIHTDAPCSVAFGVNPVATVNSARIGAGSTEYFALAAGSLIAVIANT